MNGPENPVGLPAQLAWQCCMTQPARITGCTRGLGLAEELDGEKCGPRDKGKALTVPQA